MATDSTAYLKRLDQRCHLELGFGLSDSSLLYPEAVDRIVSDELSHELASREGHV